MSDFIEKIHLRGKAEENIYFAKLNQKLLEEFHQKTNKESQKDNNLTEKPVTVATPPK